MLNLTVNPNIKFDSILEAKNSSSDFAAMFSDMKDEMIARQYDNGTSFLAYASIYSKVATQLKQRMEEVNAMDGFYLIDVIVSQIAGDALSPTMSSEEIITFSCKNKKIEKELNDLKNRIGLDQLIENIAPDLIKHGEYTLSTKIDFGKDVKNELGKEKNIKVKGKGIIDVTDTVDQGTVIALMQDGKNVGYLAVDQMGRILKKQLADYIKFQLGGHRIKVPIDQFIPLNILKEKYTDLPRFIRIGKSVIYPVLSKLKELELLEKLVPASKLNKISQGNIVGMNLPENYDLDQAMKAIRRMEGIINKKVSVDNNLKQITVESILSIAGRTKLIPVFGEKGTLQNLDYKDPDVDSLTSDAKELRTLILDSVGVPSELVYSAESGDKKEILKRYAKYLRILKRVQKACSNGCKQIAFIHLANTGIEYKEDEIDVVFNNNLVEIDNLDKLEHADITVSLLTNVKNFFADMVDDLSPYKDAVNLDKVLEYIDNNLRTVNLADAINTKKDGGPSIKKRRPEPDQTELDGPSIEADSKPEDNQDKAAQVPDQTNKKTKVKK